MAHAVHANQTFEFCQVAAAAASPPAKCFEDRFLLRLFLFGSLVKTRLAKLEAPLLDFRNYDDEDYQPKKVCEASRQLQGGGVTFFFFSLCTDVTGVFVASS